MKSGDKARLPTLRMLLSALKNRQIELGTDLDDSEFLSTLRKAIKQRADAAQLYRQGERMELAEKEEAEITVLEAYLPAQASDEEIRAAAASHIAANDLSGMRAMGPLMGALKGKFGDSADGARLSAIAKELLSEG